jgi:phosphoribosyl 1,2-cyclic phosphate phosphodiesterase
MAYCTDVSAIPPESWRHLTGLNTLVLDALRHRKHPTHFTIDQAIHAAQHTGARRTWFVHMTHDLPHAETDASLPEGIGLAYDGLTLGDLAQDTPRTP